MLEVWGREWAVQNLSKDIGGEKKQTHDFKAFENFRCQGVTLWFLALSVPSQFTVFCSCWLLRCSTGVPCCPWGSCRAGTTFPPPVASELPDSPFQRLLEVVEREWKDKETTGKGRKREEMEGMNEAVLAASVSPGFSSHSVTLCICHLIPPQTP